MSKVLIVDDSPTQAALISHILFEQNHELEIANSGKAGLAKALQGNFDLLVLDLNLPDLSGLEICQNFKSAGNRAPVLLVTSEDYLSQIIPNQPLGPDYFCVKEPATLNVRLQTIFLRMRRNRPVNQMQPTQVML